MQNVNKHVIVRINTKTSELEVFGNRHADAFEGEANAKRSLTRRRGKRNPKHIGWHIIEVKS